MIVVGVVVIGVAVIGGGGGGGAVAVFQKVLPFPPPLTLRTP